MRTALLVAVVAMAFGAVLLVVSSGDLRRSGTNNVPGGGEIGRLEPGERSCQEAEIPGGTELVAVPAYSASGAPVRLLVAASDDEGRVTASGRTLDIAPDGDPLARLRPSPRAGNTRICVTNVGRDSVTLLGIATTFGIDYYRGSESWWQASPSVARHFGFGKADFIGAWAFWVALALVGAAWVAGWRALADSGARS